MKKQERVAMSGEPKVTRAVGAGMLAVATALCLSTGLFGRAGEALDHVLSGLFGPVAAWGAALVLAGVSFTFARGKTLAAGRVLGDAALVGLAAMFVQIVAGGESGGFVGLLGGAVESWLSAPGGVALVLALGILIVLTRVPLSLFRAAVTHVFENVSDAFEKAPPLFVPMRQACGALPGSSASSCVFVSPEFDAYAVDAADAFDVEEDEEADPESERSTLVDGPTRRALPPAAYVFPPTSLLEADDAGSSGEDGSLRSEGALLIETLAAHDVEAKIESTTTGPTVSTFEVSVAPGTKLSRVVGLADDVSLAFGRKVRVAPARPGRVGFELQKERRSKVSLRGLLEDSGFQALADTAALPLALGRAASGEVVCADLGAMPHLLVAGATGSGKSVALGAFITTLLATRTPDQCKFVLVDPKGVELLPFAGAPHVLGSVATDAGDVERVLTECVVEMERRYKLLAEAGSKNIEMFNKRAGSDAKLPRIVVVVDELADLMLQDKKTFEPLLVRLAQKARAAGIHLVCATQRPSVDVITGTLKANVPSRLAFRVAQAVDSRVVLDVEGAEQLTGRGDALSKIDGSEAPVRVQCPMVTEVEIEAVVGFVQGQVRS